MFLRVAELTFFFLASLYGSTGYYAHNYEPFFELDVGEIVYVDGTAWKVKEVYEYQALQPNSPYSEFVGYGEHYTAEEMFYRMYRPGTLTLQTCIDKDGLLTWGRLFVIAVPSERIKDDLGSRDWQRPQRQ